MLVVTKKLLLLLKSFLYVSFAGYTFIQLKSTQFNLASVLEIITPTMLWIALSIAILEAIHCFISAFFD